MCDHQAVEARKHEGDREKPTVAESSAGSKGSELKTEGEGWCLRAASLWAAGTQEKQGRST